MNLQVLHTYDQFAYALVAMMGTFAAVLAINWLMHQSSCKQWLRSLRGVAPPFINIIGVLFGLMLAFISNDTWIAHDKAINAVYREADSLRSLRVLAGQVGEPLRSGLRGALDTYAQSSAAEWRDLAKRKSSKKTDNDADALLMWVVSPAVAETAGPNVQALMLKKVADLRDDRSLRIGLSQMHVNPLKWLGMAFMGMLTLLSIAVVHIDNPRAALVSITLFALAAAPTAAIVLIEGNPFQQPTSVSPQPILQASQTVNGSPAPGRSPG